MLIKLNSVSFTYNQNTCFARKALANINLTLATGEFVGVVGHMGSGKSTFLQLLNGLIKPSSGSVIIDNMETTKKQYLKTIREKVGFVFQYPEHQLFGATVFEDIAFGLKNKGINIKDIAELVKEAMELIGLDFKQYKDSNPFALSGGEQRKVAIAGILVRTPEVIVLDEPYAGLDLKSSNELTKLLQTLNRQGKTIIIVSHDMEIIFHLVKRLVVFSRGRISFDGETMAIMENISVLKEAHLELPPLLDLIAKLKKQGKIIPAVTTVEQGIREILALFGRESNAE